MTDQIKDVVRFRGANYFIAGCTGDTVFPFRPADLNMVVTEASTANPRGFYCRYVIENENHTLLTATLHLKDDEYRKSIRGKARKLYESRPEPLRVLSREISLKGLFEGFRWEYEANYVKYDNLWQVIPFSGGLLIGRNHDSQYGALVVWGYDELWELTFDVGRITMAVDRTEAMTSFRDWLRRSQSEKTESPNNTRSASSYVDRDVMMSRLKNCFASDYPFDYRY